MPDIFETVRYTDADVLFATQSSSKVEANKRTIQEMADAVDVTMTVDSIDPEIFKKESDSQSPDEVAMDKTETLRKNVLFSPEKRTLIVAFDVVTILRESPDDFDAGNGEDLKKLLRQIDFSEDVETKQLWENIIQTLDTEQVRMLEMCTQNAFAIEWHIGFALNSSDQTVVNRGAIILRATFTALNPEVVFQAFALTEELHKKKDNGERPTEKDLTAVKAFAIGPRLPFVKLIPQYADQESLVAFNRDYPEEMSALTAEEFLSLVRDCALTPNMMFELLAGSESVEPITDPLGTEPVKFGFTS